MQALYLDISKTFRKRYNIQGYGFILQSAPPDAELYIALDGLSSKLVVLNVAKLIRVESGFRFFDVVNTKAISNENVLIYVFENEYEVIEYREILQPRWAGDVGQILYEIHQDTTTIKSDVSDIKDGVNSTVSILGDIRADTSTIKSTTSNIYSKVVNIDNKMVKVDTDNVSLKYIEAAKQGKAWGLFLTKDISDGGDYEIAFINPASSPTKLYITHYEIKSNANIITFTMYSNRTEDTTNEVIPFNLDIGLSTSRNFVIKDGDFSGGTVLGTEFIDSSNKFTDSITSTGYLILRPGNSVSFYFQNNTGSSAKLGLKFYLIEE